MTNVYIQTTHNHFISSTAGTDFKINLHNVVVSFSSISFIRHYVIFIHFQFLVICGNIYLHCVWEKLNDRQY